MSLQIICTSENKQNIFYSSRCWTILPWMKTWRGGFEEGEKKKVSRKIPLQIPFPFPHKSKCFPQPFQLKSCWVPQASVAVGISLPRFLLCCNMNPYNPLATACYLKAWQKAGENYPQPCGLLRIQATCPKSFGLYIAVAASIALAQIMCSYGQE